ncbi:Prephenate dehydrogenase [Melioribacter roseus P3M-2]|uniref:Prephenate dehydrogenase n=1 Tax=Melioribacter roseus (strain DSM 23840 / JCM 17771 / VKM B-2668 / P3M-2) TaxID=1191523 RepID=I6YX52_MELRP|nr:prephenate dehydrogenase/arogenate dehydrogenase family protein [Melioribacter roseus]AFN75167.1 Prephenate dehydrogenase [Melioribacter roseus P3M-2]
MHFKKIAFLGLGLIGGSLAKALKSANPGLLISAYDRRDVLEKALNEKAIDRGLDTVEDALDDDLIFLCFPVDKSIETFKNLIPKLKPGQTISDVCSVKEIFHQIWNECGGNCSGFYIGGHPMAGKEKNGYEHSDSTLFENSVYILSDSSKNYPTLNEFADLIHSTGAHITFLNPKVHDIIVAAVSHLPQLLSVSLINSAVIKDSDINFFDFAAGGFRDMTRIAASDFNLWEPIIRYNQKNILQAIDNFSYDLTELKNAIEKGNYKLLAEKFESARKKRDEIPKNTKGFINPLFDIFVFVKDQPGVLAKITSALYEAGINIRDLELLKIRLGSGGTFRISFETQQDADKAKHIIESIGFTTRI